MKLRGPEPETRSASDKEMNWRSVRGQSSTPQGARSRLIHFLTKTDENHCVGARGDEGYASSPGAYGSHMLQMATEAHQFCFIGAVLMNKSRAHAII